MTTENDMAPSEEVSITDLADALDEPEELNSEEASTDDELAAESDEPEEGESEEEEGEESDGEKLVIDGEEFVVPKELAPLAEKLKGLENSLRADHTRKTQEAAEIRKAATQFHEQTQQVAAFQTENIGYLAQLQSLQSDLQAYENVDWAALAEQDIAAYSKHKEIRDGLREKAHQINSELENRQRFMAEKEQQEAKENHAKTVEAVKRAVPEYFEKYDNRVVKTVENLATKYGFTVDHAQLKRLSLDPLVVLGLVELSKYQDLVAKRPEVSKRIAAAPKMVKAVPAAAKPRNQEALKRLKQRGRVEDLANFL